jgi:hypothetical protein
MGGEEERNGRHLTAKREEQRSPGYFFISAGRGLFGYRRLFLLKSWQGVMHGKRSAGTTGYHERPP